MTANGSPFRHSALVYESQDEYVALSVPFLREGIEAGEGAIVANTKRGLAVMREALGADAAHMTFFDVSAAYTRPARTLASYNKVYAEQLARTPSLRAVADVQFGFDPAESDLWMGYEAVFNHCFSHLPVWVWCTYNGERLSDSVRDAVWRTHPEVIADEAWLSSDQYEDPEGLLRRITPEPVPLQGLRSIGFGRDVEELRERLARELCTEGVPEGKTLDMLLAATEIATNAIDHGGGIEDVRVGRAEGRFVCEIVDPGEGFDDPTAGYLAPREGVGRGLWVARQLSWDIEFLQSPGEFTARIWL